MWTIYSISDKIAIVLTVKIRPAKKTVKILDFGRGKLYLKSMITKHSLYLPPSSAPALLQCPCYEANKKMTDDADRGTSGHSYCETAFLGQPTKHYQGLTKQDEEDCEWAADYARSWCAANFPGQVPDTECHMELFDDEGNKITEGTLDVSCGAGIVDYKMLFDYRPEEHYFKPQMAFYALMIMRKNGFDRIKVLEVYIKPRKSKEYEITYQEASAIAEATIQRKDLENPQPHLCDFCRLCVNVTMCVAVNERLRSVMERYSPVSFDAIKDPTAIVDPEIMGKALVFVRRILEPWCEAISEQALKMSATKDIPYWVRKERSGRRSIVDHKEAFRLISERYPQFTDMDFLACSSFSFEKGVDKLAFLTGMKVSAAKKAVEEMLAPVTERSQSTTYLQMVTDKKEKTA